MSAPARPRRPLPERPDLTPTGVLAPVSVPVLGERGPYCGELREVLAAGMTSLAWACEHSHKSRQQALACARAELGRRGRGDGA